MIPGLNFARARVLPVIQQAEAAECGLACLAMVANYHGHKTDLNGMRQAFSFSLAGTTLRTLMQIAEKLDFQARAVKLNLSQLSDLKTPSILHWDLNHFVVLKSIRGRRVHIHDPAKGARTYNIEDISPHFTGVALEIAPTASFEPKQTRAPVRLSDLWSGVSGWKRAFVQLFLLSGILLLVALATPFYLQLAIDEAILKSDYQLLIVLAFAFACVYLIGAVAELLRSWSILYFGFMMTFQMIGNIFRHLIRLPVPYFEKRHIGDIISRMSSTQPVQVALTQGAVSSIIDIIVALAVAVVMIFYSALLAGLVFLTAGLYLIAAMALYPRMRARQEEHIIAKAKEQTHLMESIRSAKLIKLNGLENERGSVWKNLYAESLNAGVSAGKFETSIIFFKSTFLGIQAVLVVFAAGHLAMNSTFTIGMIFAFISYSQTFSQRIDTFVMQLVEFRLLGLHLDRLSDIINARKEASLQNVGNVSNIRGEIEIRNLNFRYGAGAPWILKDVCLKIGAGEFIAITGPSGGGKTTLLKLMLGLYGPSEGEIFLDGMPLADLNSRAWRNKCGVVMQDDQLLSGTIANNIALFDPQIEMARVHEVAKLSRVHDDILRQPMNYLSLVGDMGNTLSGGQRQRVLLARALYREPRLLFLDEGTANVDPRTEAEIGEMISDLNITRIVIAHRPELLRRADRIYEIRDGGISVL